MSLHVWLAVVLVTSAFGWGEPGPPPNGALLVSVIGEQKVVMVDAATRELRATFAEMKGSHEITISRDGELAYISDPGGQNEPGGSVVVINLSTRTRRATFPACPSVHDTRVSADGRILWVACAPAKSVLEMDAATGEVLKTYDLGLDGGWFVEATPDGSKLYVPHMEGKALSVIDRRSGAGRAVYSGATQFGVAISPDGGEVWASDGDKNLLHIVDTSNDKVVGSVSLGAEGPGFARLLFTPDGRYVGAVQGRKFTVVEARTRSVAWSIEMPHPGKVLTISDDSGYAFVSHPDDDRVSVIDLTRRSVVSTFVVGKQPDGIAWVK